MANEPTTTPPERVVLLVEDDAQMRSVLRRVLRRADFRVLEASNATEALTLAESLAEPIALLLTDVILPHETGPELAEALRRSRPETRVLYISGCTPDTLRDLGVSLESFLAKPFTPESLLERVESVLQA